MGLLLEMGEVYKDLRVLQVAGEGILVCECIFCKKQKAVREANIDHLEPCICVKASELEGTKIGTLTIIKAEPVSKGIKCICECSACGKVTERTWVGLQKIKSCGCHRNVYKDLTGKEFGRLTVLGKATVRNASNQIQWICQCNCKDENLVLKTSSALRTGNPTCGCAHKERIERAQEVCRQEGISMSKAIHKIKLLDKQKQV